MSQWQQQRAQPAPASPWAAETSAAPPATMADPYAAGHGSGSSSSSGEGFGSEPAQRGALPGRLGRSQAVALKDLRADEVEFIQRAAMKMNVIRWVSRCAALTLTYMSRRYSCCAALPYRAAS